MFNLLPDNLKKAIKFEYNTRRVVVILIFVILIQISTLVFMFPSWLISGSKEKGLELQLEKMGQSALSADATEIRDKIKIINNEIHLLDTGLQYPSLSPLVDYVLSKKTPSIRINSFTYEGGKSWTLSLKGISSTRESLVSFVDSLKKDNIFSSIDLPVSNLAKNKNIDFSIVMVVTQK